MWRGDRSSSADEALVLAIPSAQLVEWRVRNDRSFRNPGGAFGTS
jgi:hypothetical protein